MRAQVDKLDREIFDSVERERCSLQGDFSHAGKTGPSGLSGIDPAWRVWSRFQESGLPVANQAMLDSL
jgi:hypothetical protein